jgi:pyruvate/2-oxoglutarate dehydrogenase complex dihydrolipoamide acyltransferase (E2) component
MAMPEARVALRLPQLGNGVDEATVHEWFVAVGARVKAGQPVVSVESDKATVELEAPVTGSLVATVAEVGAEIMVGDVLGEFEPE